VDVEVRRIALNIDQVRRYNPPPNFAKETDSRYAGYVERFGEECWELDALSPTVIADLIRTEIEGLIDRPKWQKRQTAERRNRLLLERVSENHGQESGGGPLALQEILEQATGYELLWERLALTRQQVEDYDLPTIVKHDRPYKDGHPHEAVETEAISQRVLIDILRARLDELLPEPLARVQERETRQRRQVERLLRR
jgi:hypothetical protein